MGQVLEIEQRVQVSFDSVVTVLRDKELLYLLELGVFVWEVFYFGGHLF